MLKRHALAGALLMGGQTRTSPISTFAHCSAHETLHIHQPDCLATPAGRAINLCLGIRRYIFGNLLCLVAIVVGTGRASARIDKNARETISKRWYEDRDWAAQYHANNRFGLIGGLEANLFEISRTARVNGQRRAYVAAMLGRVACTVLMQPLRLCLALALMAVDGCSAAAGATVGLCIGLHTVAQTLFEHHRRTQTAGSAPPPLPQLDSMTQTYRVVNQNMMTIDTLFSTKAAQMNDFEAQLRQHLQAGRIIAKNAIGVQGLAVAQQVDCLKRLAQSCQMLGQLDARPLTETIPRAIASTTVQPQVLAAGLRLSAVQLSACLVGNVVASFVLPVPARLKPFRPRTIYAGFQAVAALQRYVAALPPNEVTVAMQTWLEVLLKQQPIVLNAAHFHAAEWQDFEQGSLKGDEAFGPDPADVEAVAAAPTYSSVLLQSVAMLAKKALPRLTRQDR